MKSFHFSNQVKRKLADAQKQKKINHKLILAMEKKALVHITKI